MKNYKKLLAIPCALGLLMAGLTGCNTSSGKTITIWTFSNELSQISNNYFTKDTGVKVKVVIKGSVAKVVADFNNALRSGVELPDIIAVEAAKIAAITNQPENFIDLTNVGNTEQMYDYTKSVASADGKLIGLAWQATPGGFFYKSSIAEKLGITSVEQMEAQISTWDGYLELAKKAHEYDLNPSKDGVQSIAISSSISDPVKVFLSGRENSWVENGYLQEEKIMFGEGNELTTDNCFDVVRTLHKNNYTHQTADRSSGYFADVESNNTLGFFCSSWGLNFDLIPNAGETAGDWRMCKAPSDYFKGGTWLSIPAKANNVDLAKQFIEYVTTNETFLKARCVEAGDFMNNKKVMSEVITDYQCEFLGGQNHLAKLYEVAENINGKLISPYDSDIDDAYQNCCANYAQNKDLEIVNARQKYRIEFRNAVSEKFPDIKLQ